MPATISVHLNHLGPIQGVADQLVGYKHIQLDILVVLSYNYDEMNDTAMASPARGKTHLSPDETRLAGMLKALGSPVRFHIMKTLAEFQTCITNEIVATTPLAQSTVSQHLKVLRQAGLIRGEVDGPATSYCIDPEGVLWLEQQIGGWLPDVSAPKRQA